MPAIRGTKSKSKTRRWTRGLDQVHADVHDPTHLARFKESTNKAPEDLPGAGSFYCVECAKWFESDNNLVAHRKGKPHKRRESTRLRQLKAEPYTQKEAELAVGLATDNGNAEPMTVDVDDDMQENPDPRAALL